MLIDSFQEDWLDVLVQRAEELPADCNLYLLIDGIFVHGLYRSPTFNGGAMPTILLFESLPGCTDAVRDASPFLVPIKQAHGVLVERLAKRLAPCSGWPMISAIASPESLEQLGQRLAAWCVVENDGQRFNFRFPDTRRLPGLFDALNPQQRTEMTGPMRYWMYVDRSGSWRALAVPGHDSPIAAHPVLEDAQFGQMVDDSKADEVLFRLAYGGFQPQGLHSMAYATVAGALRSAEEAELEPDLHEEWCQYVLQHPRDAVGLVEWRATVSIE